MGWRMTRGGLGVHHPSHLHRRVALCSTPLSAHKSDVFGGVRELCPLCVLCLVNATGTWPPKRGRSECGAPHPPLGAGGLCGASPDLPDALATEAFDPACLTKENLVAWGGMLELMELDGGGFDIRIDGLGVDAFLCDVAGALLEDPKIALYAPMVEEQALADAARPTRRPGVCGCGGR